MGVKREVWGRIFIVDKRSSTITVPHFVNIKAPFCSFYSI